MTHYHAVVWMDHREARIFQFNREEAERLVLHAERPTRHLHHKAGAVGPGKAAEDHAFHRAVESAVAAAGEILVVGPGAAKQEFIRHVERSDPGLRARVVGVETVDHPTDPQLVAFARRYFSGADRMRPQLG
jgi:stalled ribosome rescue protein Dom34